MCFYWVFEIFLFFLVTSLHKFETFCGEGGKTESTDAICDQ